MEIFIVTLTIGLIGSPYNNHIFLIFGLEISLWHNLLPKLPGGGVIRQQTILFKSDWIAPCLLNTFESTNQSNADHAVHE